jgi:uncharacterized protein YndB with AHSA1/START domain
MPKSEASVTINASVEKVFDAIADPEKVARYESSSLLTKSKGKPDEIGSYSEFDYHVMGMKFHARMTVSEVDKPRRLVQEMSGAMPGKWVWNLTQDDPVVKVDFSIEYSVPGGVLGNIANKFFLGRMNQKNRKSTLHNLKMTCEN